MLLVTPTVLGFTAISYAIKTFLRSKDVPKHPLLQKNVNKDVVCGTKRHRGSAAQQQKHIEHPRCWGSSVTSIKQDFYNIINMNILQQYGMYV